MILIVGSSEKMEFNLLTNKIEVPAMSKGEQQVVGAGDIHVA